MSNLEYRINNFVMDRTEDAGKIMINESDYKDVEANINSLYCEIEKLLPKEKQGLVDELLCKCNEQAALLEVYMYKQGFKDGVKLNKFLNE